MKKVSVIVALGLIASIGTKTHAEDLPLAAINEEAAQKAIEQIPAVVITSEPVLESSTASADSSAEVRVASEPTEQMVVTSDEVAVAQEPSAPVESTEAAEQTIEIDQEALEQEAEANLQEQLFKDVQTQNKESLEVTIAQGADLNAADENGNTALGIAVSFGFFDIAKILIKNGADINLADKDGRTPLIIAIKNEQPTIARFLLAKKADISLQDNEGKTALDYAKESSNSKIKNLVAQLTAKSKGKKTKKAKPAKKAKAKKTQAAKKRAQRAKSKSARKATQAKSKADRMPAKAQAAKEKAQAKKAEALEKAQAKKAEAMQKGQQMKEEKSKKQMADEMTDEEVTAAFAPGEEMPSQAAIQAEEAASIGMEKRDDALENLTTGQERAAAARDK